MKPQKINNTDRRFGEADKYFQLGEYVFTPDELERGKERYNKNPEDVLPVEKQDNFGLHVMYWLVIAFLALGFIVISY